MAQFKLTFGVVHIIIRSLAWPINGVDAYDFVDPGLKSTTATRKKRSKGDEGSEY
jgi:hypothetical protein